MDDLESEKRRLTEGLLRIPQSDVFGRMIVLGKIKSIQRDMDAKP